MNSGHFSRIHVTVRLHNMPELHWTTSCIFQEDFPQPAQRTVAATEALIVVEDRLFVKYKQIRELR